MPTRYVLIDYENVQPDTLEPLAPKLHVVLVFVGPRPAKKLDVLKEQLSRFRSGSRCVEMSSAGRNALDCVVAFYLGRLAAKSSNDSFCIVSNDKGYDPLLRHMGKDGFAVRRVSSIDGLAKDTASLECATKIPVEKDPLAAVVANLKRRSRARPGTLKSLRADLLELLKKRLNRRSVDALVDRMIKLGIVALQGNKVTYRLKAYRP